MLTKNKRGFILTTGIAAMLLVAILIIVGSLLVFVSFNKFALIGGGLVFVTLIFGLKGEFSKQKAIFMVLIISLGLFFVLGGNMLQTQFGPAPAHVFMDGELGMVSTYVESALSEQAYFKNTGGSGISVSNIGQKVKICDSFLNNDVYTYTHYNWLTKLNNQPISDIGITGWANRNTQYCREWTPNSAGTYEVVSYYTLCKTTEGWACDTVDDYHDRATKEGNSYWCPNYGTAGKIVDGVKICANNKCAVSDVCSDHSSDSTKSYYLEVKSKEDACNKKPYTSDWYVAQNIANGKVLKSKVFKVTNDCSYAVNYELVQTQCNDGYVIEGTNLRSTTNEGWDCVSTATDDPDDDGNNDGVDDDYTGRDDECNVDLEIECGDGTKIVDKLCFDGLYFDAGSTCSVIGDDGNDDDNRDDDNDGITNDKDDDDDNDGIKDDVDDDDDNNGIPDDEETEVAESFMQTYGYYIIGGIFVIIVLALFLFRRKRK